MRSTSASNIPHHHASAVVLAPALKNISLFCSLTPVDIQPDALLRTRYRKSPPVSRLKCPPGENLLLKVAYGSSAPPKIHLARANSQVTHRIVRGSLSHFFPKTSHTQVPTTFETSIKLSLNPPPAIIMWLRGARPSVNYSPLNFKSLRGRLC